MKKKDKLVRLPDNKDGWESLVNRTLGGGLLNGVVAIKDLPSI